MVQSAITDEYRELNRKFHEERGDWGGYGSKWAPGIKELSKTLNTQNILDYGAGKKTLAAALPFPIRSYEPAFDTETPSPADIVVCTHVLEHVEPECLSFAVSELKRLTKKALFLVAGTGESGKILPDGRDSNLIQVEVKDWVGMLEDHFTTIRQINRRSFQRGIIKDGQCVKTLAAIITP